MKRPLLLHMIDELRMGGAQTHLVTMLKEWKRRDLYDHKVLVLFGDGPLSQSVRELGFEVISLNLAPWIQSHSYWKAQKAIRQLLDQHQPDLVEAHLTYSRLLGLFSALRAGINKRFGFEQGDIYFNSAKWRAANFVGQFYADKVIVCSHTLKKWVSKTHGISPGKLEVFYNCIDPHTFVPSRHPKVSRAELGIPPESVVFGAVGTLGAGVNKRMDVCIEALSMVHQKGFNPFLLICGDGPKRTELETQAKRLGLSAFVKFLGTRNDVPDVFSLCTAFCHAAPFEPFGIVCIEAMLMELPVIVPNSGGISEIVNDSIGFKYKPLSGEGLAEKMLNVIRNPEDAKKMGQAGKSLALKDFAVGPYISRLQKLYQIGEHQ